MRNEFAFFDNKIPSFSSFKQNIWFIYLAADFDYRDHTCFFIQLHLPGPKEVV